jgi:predicted GIY-YIG superfamily endonuclease
MVKQRCRMPNYTLFTRLFMQKASSLPTFFQEVRSHFGTGLAQGFVVNWPGMAQALLFPDPKPLDERLGRKFFRKAPRRPGVYLMKDDRGKVLYVGKAKDLKQRLNHYRLANPDRMVRRHLRLVREMSHIEFQFCASEAAALRRESVLLRSLRPKFNRAGVWPGKTRFIVWRVSKTALELGVAEVPAPGWHRFGPLNSSAVMLHQSFCRLLWLVLNPATSAAGLPAGWARGCMGASVTIHCANEMEFVAAGLKQFFWEDPAWFLSWLGNRLSSRNTPFEQAVMAADFEALQNFSTKRSVHISARAQLALL